MRLALTALVLSCAVFVSGCASVPNLAQDGGLPLGKSGWQFSGGIDLQRQAYWVCFVKPFGAQKRNLTAGWDK